MRRHFGRKTLAIVILLGLGKIDLFAGSPQFSGLAFGDYYYLASSHDSSLAKRNGFWIRRIYLTYTGQIDQSFSYRLRFEMNNKGDFSSTKLYPFVKDAYLKWTKGNSNIYMGISPSPTFAMVEKIWGYRAVEKSALNFQKMGKSRMFGLAYLWRYDSIRLHAGLSNGKGNASDDNTGKKMMLSIGYFPKTGILFEVYGDFDDRDNGAYWSTWQTFIGYQNTKFRGTILIAAQKRHSGGDEDDVNINVVSFFGALKLGKSSKLFGRVDMLKDPNPNASKIDYIPVRADADYNLIIAGYDWAPSRNVHLVPNIELIRYNDSATSNELMYHLTFYYKW